MRSSKRPRDGSILRVAAFAPYPEEGPSTRFRLAQFRDPLLERGIWLDVLPFVRSESYGGLYGVAGWITRGGLLFSGLRRRLHDLSLLDGYDVAVVHRELAPVLNGVLLRALGRTHAAFVYDFDDAVFLPPRGGNALLALVRTPGPDTSRFCREATRVLAGNGYLADFARRARDGGSEDPNVRVFPTVLDTDRFHPSVPEEGETLDDGLPVLGWVGTHSTLPYLESLYPVLRELSHHNAFRLRVVSNVAPPPPPGVDLEFVRWTPEEETSYFGDMDIGLYPLADDPWTRGKCGFKAIQYLACGVPAVASPVGVIPEIVVSGVTGELAESDDEWISALESLLDDPERRLRMGAAGREHVVAHYSVTGHVDGLADALRGAARVNGWPG